MGSRRNCERLAAAAAEEALRAPAGAAGSAPGRAFGLAPRKRIRGQLRESAAGGADEARARARDAAEAAGVAGLRANAMDAADFQRLLLAMHARGLRLAAYGAKGDGDSR